MARKKSDQLTDVEQSIMQILWQKGDASVKDIAQILSEEKKTAYTTAQTMCKILTKKGYTCFEKQGRTFIYSPTTTQKQAQKTALGSFLKNFFSGSESSLAQHLIEEDEMDLQELEELEKIIKQKKENKS